MVYCKIPFHIAYTFIFVTLDLLIISIQPPSHAGKVNGFKLGLKYLFGSIGMLIVGYIWNTYDELNEWKFTIWMYNYSILPIINSILLSIVVLTKHKNNVINHNIIQETE